MDTKVGRRMPLSEAEILGSLSEILSEDADMDPFRVSRDTRLDGVLSSESTVDQVLADIAIRFNVRLDGPSLLACENVGDVVAAIQADQP